MGFQFCQIRDVADVIAFSRLLAIISNDLASGDFLHECNRLENRDAVFASAPQVIDLGRPWILNEFFDGADGIVTVDVVANLDRKSTRLNSSHMSISYAVFCLKKKK